MRGQFTPPKKVEIVITTPGEHEDQDKEVRYTFVDIEQASITMETLTRGLTWDEQAERGFPILRERVILGSKVLLELTTKEPKK